MFDPKCYELAEHFLPSGLPSGRLLDELAQHIQDAIEDWLEAERERLNAAALSEWPKMWQEIESHPQDGTWFLTCSPSGALAIARPIGPGDDGYEVAYGCEFEDNDMPTHWMAIPPHPAPTQIPGRPWKEV